MARRARQRRASPLATGGCPAPPRERRPPPLFERFGLERVRGARGPASSRAGCASGSPSPGRCSPASRCSSSTSRSPRSTRSPAPQMQEWLAEALAAESRTVVLVSHDVEEALYLADRVVVLSARPARVRRGGPLPRPAPHAPQRDGELARVRRRARGGDRRAAGGRRCDLGHATSCCRRWSSSPSSGSGSLPRAGTCSPTRSTSSPSWSRRRARSPSRCGTTGRCCGTTPLVTIEEVVAGLALALVGGRGDRRGDAPLADAAARALSAAGRLADRAGDRDRADPGRLVRLRHRPEAGDHRARLLLPGDGQHARRAAGRRSRAGEDDAHARRRPLADPAPSRGALRPPLLPQRRQDRRRDRRDRRGLRRVVGRRRGARAPDPGLPGAAADGPGVRGRVRPLADRDRAGGDPDADPAPLRLVGIGEREPAATGGARGGSRGRGRRARAAATATTATGTRALHPRARLLRQPRPRRHLPGRSAEGDFADAGLEVDPQVPSDPSAPIRQVAAGRVDLAISYEPEVVLARDQGLPVVAVARARPAAADLADLAAGGGDRRARPTSTARRSPPRASPTRRRSWTRSSRTRGSPQTTSTRSRSA